MQEHAELRGAIEAFDRALVEIEGGRRADDLFILTADHGNDPTNGDHTDHTREFVPLLVYGDRVRRGTPLGTRTTFADIGATIAEAFGVPHDGAGSSFLEEILARAGEA